MALTIRFPRLTGKHPWKVTLLRAGCDNCGCCCILFYCLRLFVRQVSARCGRPPEQPIFASTAKIYAAPREVRPGQKLTIRLIANELREAGYSVEAPRKPLKWELQGRRAGHHRASRPAVVPRAGRRGDSCRRGSVDSITTIMTGAIELRTGAAAHHRTQRRSNAPSAGCSPTPRFRRIWCRPCWPSRTGASLSTAA